MSYHGESWSLPPRTITIQNLTDNTYPLEVPMNTTLHHPADGRLLVADESGTVIFSSDQVTVTQRYLDTHPFIHQGTDGRWYVGPDSELRARGAAVAADYLTFEVVTSVAGSVTLQKIEEV